jgi:hypothetical protein
MYKTNLYETHLHITTNMKTQAGDGWRGVGGE